MQRRLTTVLAADVVGYSRLMGTDEAGALAALTAHRMSVLEPKAAQYGGRIIKLMGDGLLMEFASVVDAVAFAVEIQFATRDWNATRPDGPPLEFRIGVNIGDVIVDGDDIHGDGVNVATRLEELSQPGGICIHRNVRNQVRDKLDLGFEDMGEVRVKNIARAIRAFHIVLDDRARALTTPIDPGSPSAASVRWQRALAVGAALVVCVAVAAYLALRNGQDDPNDLSPPDDRPSVAVLPFTNLSDDSAQGYFADGLTDDLITDLSKLSSLFVISRNTVFTYKDAKIRTEHVAEELGVRYVVEGSVRRAGGRVRVNAQLVEGRTGHQVWADRFDREDADILAVQDALVGRIVSALAVKLTGAEEARLMHRAPTEFEAYDLYLKAREGHFSRDPDRMRESLKLFAQSWSIDPGFARAYAGYASLAADIWRLSSLRGISGASLRRSAELASEKALSLDPTLSETHSVLAMIRMVDKDHDAASAAAQRAVELEPSSAHAHATLGIVLSYAGQPEKALASMREAMRLNPRPPAHHRIYLGLALVLNRRFADAAEALEPIADTPDRSLGDSPREILAMAYAKLGADAKARAQIAAMQTVEPFLNVAYYRVVYSHHARAEDLNFRLGALAEAGLPAWPLDFDPGPRRRLTAEELAPLIFGKTWKGYDAGRDAEFIQEFATGEGAVFAAETGLLNGSAFVRKDEICERYEGFVLGRDLCGPVYADPEGRPTERPYAYVNPATVRYFAVE